MKINQSLLVKASILLVLSLSFIHAQWGTPFGGGGFPQQYGLGGNPFSTGGLGSLGGLGGMSGSPFSFDQPYSSPFGNNYGQNFPNYGYGQNPYGQNPYGQNQQQPNYGNYQPSNNNNNNNNMRLRFAGQVYGYNPFYYVANLVAVDLDYISHYASALTNTGYQGYNPFYDPINGMNSMGNQNPYAQNQQQKQNDPSTSGSGAAASNTGGSGSSTPSQADIQKANQEALALVFAKEVQIHVSHLVKQQDSYGPKGVGTLTTQLVDSADKLVTAANAKKWNDYQQEYSNLNNGLNKITYYGMQQNMPTNFNQIPSQFQPPAWPNQNQQNQQNQQNDPNAAGNVKGSSYFPFLGNNGQFTMPQAPQAPTVPQMPQQFASLQQQMPKQFSFPDMPQMPQIPQMQQTPQVISQQQQQKAY